MGEICKNKPFRFRSDYERVVAMKVTKELIDRTTTIKSCHEHNFSCYQFYSLSRLSYKLHLYIMEFVIYRHIYHRGNLYGETRFFKNFYQTHCYDEKMHPVGRSSCQNCLTFLSNVSDNNRSLSSK